MAAPSSTEASTGTPAGGRPVVIASKPFAESRLVGEMFAQQLEHAGIPVERRFGLAGSDVCFGAMQAGEVDLYAEYTGTGWMSLLGRPAMADSTAMLREVRREFRTRWRIEWLGPLGFDNTWALAVRGDVAKRLDITTIGGVAARAKSLRAAFTHEFLERQDGLPALARAYGGLDFAARSGMGQALRYEAAERNEVDVIDVYATDGRIAGSGLVVVTDDRHFFPPYECAPIARADALERHPKMAAALAPLSDAFDAETMRALNRRVEVDQADVAVVAREALAALGLAGQPAATTVGRASLWHYMIDHRFELTERTAEHVVLVLLAVLAASLFALPAGTLLVQRPRAAQAALSITGALQAIPSLALLAFLIPVFGIGRAPALAALTAYAVLPILRNTYTGVRDAAPDAALAAVALGMSPLQVLWRVRLPLAAPTVVAGIRTAAVVSVGTATLAALIGAGGLGDPILTGLSLFDTRRVLAGALPAALLALAVDGALGLVERRLRTRVGT